MDSELEIDFLKKRLKELGVDVDEIKADKELFERRWCDAQEKLDAIIEKLRTLREGTGERSGWFA